MKMHFLQSMKNKVLAYYNGVNSPIPLLNVFKG